MHFDYVVGKTRTLTYGYIIVPHVCMDIRVRLFENTAKAGEERHAPSRKTMGFSGALGSSPAVPMTMNV